MAHQNTSSYPTEDELNTLYDEVIAGFTREPVRNLTLDDVRIPEGEDDFGEFIARYGDPLPNIPPPPPLPTADPPSYKPGAFPAPPVEKGPCSGLEFSLSVDVPICCDIAGSPSAMPTSPPMGRARPLPRPPPSDGTSSGSSYVSPGSISMPEPHPYAPTASPQQGEFRTNNRTSLSSTGSGANVSRRLPPPPEAYASDPSGFRPSSAASSHSEVSRANGLPRSVRPPGFSTATSHTSIAGNSIAETALTTMSIAGSSRATGSLHPYAVATPITDTPVSQLPSPNWSLQDSSSSGISGANGHTGANLLRTPSGRPKGALAPVVPGQSNLSLYSDSPTSVSSPDFNSRDNNVSLKHSESPQLHPSGSGSSANVNGMNGAGSYTRPSIDEGQQEKGASSPAIGSGNGSLLGPTCQHSHSF